MSPLNLFIAKDSEQQYGGGFSFIGNFRSGMAGYFTEVDTPEKADVCLLPSSSMVHPTTVERIEKSGRPMVLRLDNIPRNSRNRNTGTSRLIKYARRAKLVIFQSEWAKGYILPTLAKNNVTAPHRVIYNGVNTGIFNTRGPEPKKGRYLYSRFNRDETKNWHVVWYEYQMIHRRWEQDGGDKPELWLVGAFSDELREYAFDFYNGEDVKYLGIAGSPQQYAQYLKSCETVLAPYYNDACSNTIVEAFCCGRSVDTLGFGHTGGTPELFNLNQQGFDWSHTRMVQEYYEAITDGLKLS